MKQILIFSLILILFVGISDQAFADVTIVPVAGSGAPGCESSGCYSPSVAYVDVGEKVIFSNTDSAAHTFTSGDSTMPDTVQILFDSGMAMAGSTFVWSPTEAGNVPYFCMVHPWMQGLIVVSGSSTTPTPTPAPTPAYPSSAPYGTDVTIQRDTATP